MKGRKTFSKDNKVILVTIEEFLMQNNYLQGITRKDLWKTNSTPQIGKQYYKFTSNYLIAVVWGSASINFGQDSRVKLEKIIVANRDGKTEYDLFKKVLKELKEEKIKHKRSKKLDERIVAIEKARKLLPKYQVQELQHEKPFESYLQDTGYKTERNDLKDKYLVFDIETNGIRVARDDLLSLSIYDPTSGICYNRYFPLDLQPLVLTGFIHGITDETLSDATHMTQEEMDWLKNFFHLKDRKLLSFSGGKGGFDPEFIQNYCKRHKIEGFTDLQYDNIKSRVPKAPYGSEGQLTKDNLCRIFGIDGVKQLHSSYDDCILEWKLFEKLESECVFFIKNHLFKYTPEYIIPYSYLFQNEELIKYAGIKLPTIGGKAEEIFRFSFPHNVLKKIKKFPTNITGITIEHGINSYLKAEKQDNSYFLTLNKSHLKYIGSIDKRIKDIPIILVDDGTTKAVNKEDEELVEDVNNVTKLIIEEIKPVADYLKENIFVNGIIKTQELVISDDKKMLALCDLSDKNSIVEIKTYKILLNENNEMFDKNLLTQLYLQAKGRDIYVLSIDFIESKKEKHIDEIEDLKVFLYKIDLFECNPKFYEVTLKENSIKIIKAIKENPKISVAKLCRITNSFSQSMKMILKRLEELGYIKKENSYARNSPWLLLRDIEDVTTIIEKRIPFAWGEIWFSIKDYK